MTTRKVKLCSSIFAIATTRTNCKYVSVYNFMIKMNFHSELVIAFALLGPSPYNFAGIWLGRRLLG